VSAPEPVQLERRTSPVFEIAAMKAGIEGLDLPGPGRFLETPGGSRIAIGPGRWLFLHETAALQGAAVIDQSHGLVLFTLTGPLCREQLMRGCRMDLRDAAFGAGSAAPCMIGQIHAVLLCDAPGEAYRILVAASYAEDFEGWAKRVSARL
jgi:heterotetrameric sarcosine oxidase gamma subunit